MYAPRAFALLSLALCICSSLCNESVSLNINDDGGRLQVRTRQKYFDTNVRLVSVVEFDDSFNANSISWGDINGDNPLENEVGAIEWCTSFSYEGEESFTFDNDGVSLGDGVAADFTCNRENSAEDGLIFARAGQAQTDGTYQTTVNGETFSVDLREGAYKVDIIFEWPSVTSSNSSNTIVLEIVTRWDLDEEAFGQNVINNQDIPDIDADTSGNCVSLSIESSFYEFCYPAIPLRCYDTTTGTAESPTSGEVNDRVVAFSIQEGERELANNGFARYFILIEARQAGGAANAAKIPERCELDPTHEATDDANALTSWLSWWM